MNMPICHDQYSTQTIPEDLCLDDEMELKIIALHTSRGMRNWICFMNLFSEQNQFFVSCIEGRGSFQNRGPNSEVGAGSILGCVSHMDSLVLVDFLHH